MTPRKRFSVIRDPVHGDVYLTHEEIAILDTPEMQRLRGVVEIGNTYYVPAVRGSGINPSCAEPARLGYGRAYARVHSRPPGSSHTRLSVCRRGRGDWWCDVVRAGTGNENTQVLHS